MHRVHVYHVAQRQLQPMARIALRHPAGGPLLVVDAASLLAQYQLPSGDVLLVLDEDCPFEERLHLVLARGSRILDHIAIGWIYTSGIYREIPTDDAALHFHFEGRAVWRVEVRADGIRRVGGLPSGARRRGRWFARRYLLLSRQTGV